METLSLREVTPDNFDEVVKLSDTLSDYQKSCVARNLASLAQAYVNKDRAWPRAIYLDEKPIGFIMLALYDEDIPEADQPGYYLWRFMMAAEHQKKGYGRQVLDQVVKKAKGNGIKTFYTSCGMEGKQPYDFYTKYGFLDTGLNDGEQILRMDLSIQEN